MIISICGKVAAGVGRWISIHFQAGLQVRYHSEAAGKPINIPRPITIALAVALIEAAPRLLG